MTTRPLVSVIVVVRNAEKTIARTLDSILMQTWTNIEIVLIDGASTDGTLGVLEHYRDRFSAFLSEPDRGIADAYNKGIARAKGDWIYFLNADDVFYAPTTLADCFAQSPFAGCDLVVGKVIADNGRVFDGRYTWMLLVRNMVHHQAIFYRALLLKNQPYNIQYRRYGHDHEHNLLLWRNKASVIYLDLPIALWASGGISDGAKWKDYVEEFRIRRNVLGLAGLPFNVFTIARFLAKRVLMLRAFRRRE